MDNNGNISFSFGTGTTPTQPCASTPPGLKPADFASGSSRFLDVVDGNGSSVLPNPPGRIPLTAVAFALSAPFDGSGLVDLTTDQSIGGNKTFDGALKMAQKAVEG